jgi:hypothetical protein
MTNKNKKVNGDDTLPTKPFSPKQVGVGKFVQLPPEYHQSITTKLHINEAPKYCNK